MKKRLMIVAGYLGAVIGAGFASGQEIVQFFVSYGSYGFRGVLAAAILFALCGGLLLYKAHREKVSDYQALLNNLLGRNAGRIVEVFLIVFLFLGISTMLSASGAVFYEHLYLPKDLGIWSAYVLVLVLLFSGSRGLFRAFNILVPLKIILLLFITGMAVCILPEKPLADMAAYPALPVNQWQIASLLYVAYNFALAMVVLTEYQSISSAKEAILGAVWGGAVLGILLMVCYLALLKTLPEALHYQVPMLHVAGQVSVSAKYIYTAVLWLGILTTAIANAFGVARWFSGFSGLSFSTSLFLGLTLALPLAWQSFSALVGKIYPLFGLLGITIVLLLLYKAGKDILSDIYYNIVKMGKAPRR